MAFLKLLLLTLFVYFIVAIVNPIQAVSIWSLTTSYVYIAITEIMMYIVTVAVKVRGLI